ncbi:MAG: aminodeoxychorismate/anthranilate synthase component II [Bacteroidetes bacterium HGW-Bacteroidetes-4]|nr:MAG: aminodeoxychorismate/anthranilate synthase component II [Bacteroidetes bacterium HGW-Bacteroidetes-4]
MPAVLIIDNHDSFTYNLLETLRQTGLCLVDVVLLEEFHLVDLQHYQGVILSPGPGLPEEKPGLFEVIKKLVEAKIAVLGVCLGHQALAQYFGARLQQLERVVHGEASPLKILGDAELYRNIGTQPTVGRYHSWVVTALGFPDVLELTATTEYDLIMGFKHRALSIRGVQFHPESILTPQGSRLLSNWLYSIGNGQ